MRRSKPYDELTAHANALAALCTREGIAHLEINIGESAVIWRRYDVPQWRDNETVRISNGKTERW